MERLFFHSMTSGKRAARRRVSALGLVRTRARAPKGAGYLPMQKREKISPSKSSAVVSPVIAPSAV
jgi:hypothetical protein